MLGALPYVIGTWLDSKGDAQKGLELLLNIQNQFFTKIQAVWSQTEVNTQCLFTCCFLFIESKLSKVTLLMLLHLPKKGGGALKIREKDRKSSY